MLKVFRTFTEYTTIISKKYVWLTIFADLLKFVDIHQFAESGCQNPEDSVTNLYVS